MFYPLSGAGVPDIVRQDPPGLPANLPDSSQEVAGGLHHFTSWGRRSCACKENYSWKDHDVPGRHPGGLVSDGAMESVHLRAVQGKL